jgi:transposase
VSCRRSIWRQAGEDLCRPRPLKETAICIVDEVGKIVWERMVATDPEVLSSRHLASSASASRAVPRRPGCGASSSGAACPRLPRPPSRTPCALDEAQQERSQRCPRARRSRAHGLVPQGPASGRLTQFVRSMLLRQQLLQARRSIENQMRGALKALGAMTGPTKGCRFMPRVIALRAEHDWLGPVIDPLLAAHTAIAKQLKAVSNIVLAAARDDADVRRMMIVAGIGAMTALAFKAAIDDPKRFTSSMKVGPNLGLTPRQHQSGELSLLQRRIDGLTKRSALGSRPSSESFAQFRGPDPSRPVALLDFQAVLAAIESGWLAGKGGSVCRFADRE